MKTKQSAPQFSSCSTQGHNYVQLGTIEVTGTLIVCCSRCADVKRIPVQS